MVRKEIETTNAYTHFFLLLFIYVRSAYVFVFVVPKIVNVRISTYEMYGFIKATNEKDYLQCNTFGEKKAESTTLLVAVRMYRLQTSVPLIPYV